MNQEQFLAERRSGIGGSDIHHVLSIEPWGCALRLWYEKRDEFPDVIKEVSRQMIRGQKLEALVADEYEGATGRQIYLEPMARHPAHSELLVHTDRAIDDADGHPDVAGILECKTAGRELFFRYKLEGLPPGYVMQLQHAMLVTGRVWGSFALLWPDGWQLLWWDVDADEEFQVLILNEALAFWGKVENGPSPRRLDADDSRCHRCPFVQECQGAAMEELLQQQGLGTERDSSLAPLVDEYLETKETRDTYNEAHEGAKSELKAAIGARLLVQVPGVAKCHFRPNREWDVNRLEEERPEIAAVYKRKWDLSALSKDHPELDKEYKRASRTRPLKVYPVRGYGRGRTA